jgi:flagellar secretion chaperone FliS
MDPKKQKFETYRKTEVLTANRETLLLMMYAGAIRFLKGAITAAEKNDLPEKNRLVMRTQQIISELRATLNFEAGKDIALRLETLYGFITRQLMQATSDKTVEPLKESLEILNTLHTAWEEAIASLKKEQTNKA